MHVISFSGDIRLFSQGNPQKQSFSCRFGVFEAQFKFDFHAYSKVPGEKRWKVSSDVNMKAETMAMKNRRWGNYEKFACVPKKQIGIIGVEAFLRVMVSEAQERQIEFKISILHLTLVAARVADKSTVINRILYILFPVILCGKKKK